MSWMSKKTGRPKEEGGHKRVNISLSRETLKVLNQIKTEYGDLNFSQFVEFLIKLYPDLEENSRVMTELMLKQVLELLKKFGKF